MWKQSMASPQQRLNDLCPRESNGGHFLTLLDGVFDLHRRQLPIGDSIDAIIRAAATWPGDERFRDDISVLALQMGDV
jgi:hypothetical protein